MAITASLDNSSAASLDAKLGKGLNDFTPLFGDIARILERNFNTRFNARIDPDGKAWMPWADSTHEQRQRQKRGKLLQFSNPGMRNSVRRKFDNKSASIEMLSPIAGYHEQVEAPKTNRLPRRAMLFSKGGGLGEMDRVNIEQVSQLYFMDLFS